MQAEAWGEVSAFPYKKYRNAQIGPCACQGLLAPSPRSPRSVWPGVKFLLRFRLNSIQLPRL